MLFFDGRTYEIRFLIILLLSPFVLFLKRQGQVIENSIFVSALGVFLF